MNDPLQLTRRERQIMEIMYARGEVTVNDLVAEMPDPPSNTAVRTFLKILEEKGHAIHQRRGKENYYKAVRARSHVAKGALRRLLDTFFAGSIERALATHLSDPKTDLTQEQLISLQELIKQARIKGE